MRGHKPHVLKRGNGKRGSPAAGAVEYELFVLTENFFEIGAFGIDPKLDHAARCVNACRYETGPLPFADIPDIDNDNFGIVQRRDQVRGLDLFYTRTGIGDHLR